MKTVDADPDISRKTHRPHFVFQDSLSSEATLRGRQMTLGCDSVAPLAAQVGLESASPGRLHHNNLPVQIVTTVSFVEALI